MPKEYIERSKAVEVIKDFGKGAIEDGQKTLDPVDDIILLQGAVGMIRSADVVEVVRCKDCEFVKPTKIKINGKDLRTCDLYKRPCYDNDFCSRGVRKDGASDE